jgi:hypothetical protein
VRESTVKFSTKVPEAVVNDFVKVAPTTVGVGENRLITVPGPGEPGTT